MTLEFMPEIEESLKQRYPKALKPMVGRVRHEKVHEEFREHVFDFYDGLRVIASKECANLLTMFCYTASMHQAMDFDDSIEFTAFVLEHINKLRDKPVSGVANITYEDGVLYLSIPENPIYPRLN